MNKSVRTENEPRVVRPHEDGIDVYVRPGLLLEFSFRGSRVYFHGLTMEGKHNVGSGFEQPIDGSPIPEGEFTNWLRAEARKVSRMATPSDRTWFYCASCRIAVHPREVGYEVPEQGPYHFKCGGDVEVRES